MKRIYLTRSLALRLTLWYAGVLAASAVLCFGLAYFLFSSITHRRAERYLREQVDEARVALARDGIKGLTDQIAHEARSTGTNDLFIRVLSAEGKIVAASDLAQWNVPRIAAHQPPPAGAGAYVFETWTDLPAHPFVRVLYADVGEGLRMQLGLSMTADNALLREMARTSMGFIVGAVGIAILVGWLLARRALSGVGQVTGAAVGIAAGRLDHRVPTTGWDDEVDRLARTFNQMADRVQALVEGIKQTNDNIAHELRSPITRMRGQAEVSLAEARPDSPHQELAENTLEECDRLLALINTMLDIAEVEAGVTRLTLSDVDLTEVLRDACDIFEPVAENAGVTLEPPPAGGPVRVQGDMSKLQRVIANLLDNAIKYTPGAGGGGAVRAEVRQDRGMAEIVIADTGPGIPESDIPHIFQRFYRGEKSRTRKGYGLGLSLAQAIVRAHGGTIEVANTPPRGCRFTIRLPVKPALTAA